MVHVFSNEDDFSASVGRGVRTRIAHGRETGSGFLNEEASLFAFYFQKSLHAVDVLVEFFEEKRKLEFVERLVVGIREARDRRIVRMAFGFVFFERISEVVGHFETPGIEK